MAQAVVTASKLRLVFQVGMDDEGKPVLKGKTFNNIQKSATPDQLLQAAQALIGLSNDTLSTIERVENADLLA
ncbi:DUF1659 domain-containing protein [Neobacillus sp. 179-C4.2 HS]|uniref:DUF1659 domain-containing protein n=1 Tax=Neobacillus driksii TaxID=3035913 RepID=A0ABV4YZH0_9BACI|nr:DUF1659 domain-containing protein [Neobacillus sp. 179.-C4.2 HS]MDP5197390.1 DUF1659 domain-containing protein [Neobacillus sp. 179.-C4.2 HS]MDP5197391.1 DUF1659 domain-containing protein [Neobacillus sp. 179.-C4.2 HS]